MAAQWDDLKARTLSGVAMAVGSLVLLVAGGVWFHMLTVFVAAVMIWELWTMIAPERPKGGMLLTALTATVLAGLLAQPGPVMLLLFLVTPLAGALALKQERAAFFAFALGIQVAAWGLTVFRDSYGLIWILWLVLVVVGTDIAGYFAGRIFGGPKFWPSLSPKKTWSGTGGGWVVSGLIGAAFAVPTEFGLALIPLSMALSFASQMGDITESALKRRMGVKDSSDLIPGHGGLFDRFDGLLGGALFMLLVSTMVQLT